MRLPSWQRLLKLVSSTRLTIGCLLAAVVLVFAGTLAQVTGFRIPIFPAGHLLGAVLLVNLFAAHFLRFRLTLHYLGVHLIHSGLILLLAGGLFTDWFSVESEMRLTPGEPRNYSDDTRRSIRYYRHYSITLQKFTHERYPGTDIPKMFASQITLSDPTRAVNREAVISMNHPFRYAGETYYQSGFGDDDRTSVLLVVRNPCFLAPYFACAVISLGLCLHFCRRLAFAK